MNHLIVDIMMFTKSKLIYFTIMLFALFTFSIVELNGQEIITDSLQMAKVNELVKNYQYDKAVCILETLVAKDSSNYDAVSGLENLYFKQNQLNAAVVLQDYMLKKGMDSTYYSIRKGLCLKKMGQNQQSLDILLQGYGNDTLNSFLANQIGDLFKSLNKTDSAIYFYHKTCEVKANATVMIKAMDLHLKAQRAEAALGFYEEFYQEDFARNNLLHRLYGRALYRTGKVKSSQKVFEGLYANGDSSLVTTKYLGMCNWKLELYSAAIAPLEHFLVKDSTDFQVYYMLGSCLVNDEFVFNPDKSIAYLTKAVDLIQADGRTLNLIYNELALNYQRTQQHDKELEVYMLMKENAPDSKYVDYKLATLYDYGLKDKKEALGRYQKLLAYYQSDRINDGKESDIEKFCKNRIEELNEERFWESE